jgi:hypothetical protein
MDKKQVALIALFGAVVGCAATQVAQVRYAEAQYEPGQMRECAALMVGPLLRASEAIGRSTQVPPAWTPIGGTATNNSAGVVICR